MEYNESNHDEKMEDQHKDNNKTNRIRSQMNINDLSNPIEDDRSASTTNSTSVSPTTKKSMNHNESKENRVSSNVVRSLNLPPTQSQSLQPLKLSSGSAPLTNDRTWSLPNNYQATTSTTETNIYSPTQSNSNNSPTHNNNVKLNRIIPHIVSPQLQVMSKLHSDSNINNNNNNINNNNNNINNNNNNNNVGSFTIQSQQQHPQSVVLSPPPSGTQYQTPLSIGQPMLPHQQRQSISGIPLSILQKHPSLQQQRPSLVATSWPPLNTINNSMMKYNNKMLPKPTNTNSINMEFGSPTPPTQRSETTTPILTESGNNNVNNPNISNISTNTSINTESHSDDSGVGRNNSNPHDDESETIYLSKKGTRRLRDSKRAVQNRNAQKAFRQRKEKYVRLLENKARKYDELMQENVTLRREIINLKNIILQLDQRLQMFNDYYVNELQHQPLQPQPLQPPPPPQQIGLQMHPPHQYPPPPPPPQQPPLGPPPPPPL